MANPNYKRKRTKLHIVRVPANPYKIKVAERYLKPLLHPSEEEKVEIYESIESLEEYYNE